MSQRVNDGTDTISECEIRAVFETNNWESGENRHNNKDPSYLKIILLLARLAKQALSLLNDWTRPLQET
jgi:hypothetical protein